MDEWLGSLTAASQRRYHELEPDCLSGQHHWYAPSFDARPTYCNVCRYKINARHLLRCEVCKFNVHKRCAAKAINNCKWTTLASVGKDIIEDADGNIVMPHQWMEGNIPVLSKCAVCSQICGSVLSLQDWRCLWCHATVHTQCRPSTQKQCPLGPARVSVVPPTALHSVQDESWEVVRPQASSPLLVFVNSKSGDNQGVKFLRRFKQLLNPAQVFDLISTGPRLGLRLFGHFDPFRILVCSGDGSVGWVLSEIDKLDMHKQCQVAVLPLGTGNDLARVLGWGASCDSDAHLPQLLEKYERASVKMLDRWSVMAFERTIAVPKLSLTPGQPEGQLHGQITQYEESLKGHLQNILQSDETSVIINSAKVLCETVKDLRIQINECPMTRGDEQLAKLSDILQQKQELLIQALTNDVDVTTFPSASVSEESSKKQEDTDSEISFDRGKTEKCEKDLSNFNFRKHRRTSRFMEREKDALNNRANSLKKALKNLVEHTEQVFEERTRQAEPEVPSVKISLSNDIERSPRGQLGISKMDSLKVVPSIESGSSSDASSCPSPTGSVVTARLVNISPIPDVRRDSVAATTTDDADLLTLPVPPDFADSRRSSRIQQGYMATGESYRSLAFAFRISHSYISHLVKDTLRAINKHMVPIFIPPPTHESLKENALEFSRKWNFPHCVAAIDGKHVRLVCPKKSGSLFFNYKEYYSIVLLAMVDANYKFVAVDVGSYGKEGDSGIFSKSIMGRQVDSGVFFPPDEPLIGLDKPMPYVIVGDEAFRLHKHVMKPYTKPAANADKNKAIFNYRLCRARRVSENAFGILCQIFRVFFSPIAIKPGTCDTLILAACALHNLLRSGYMEKHAKPHYEYDPEEPPTGFIALRRMGGFANSEGFEVRENLSKYFNQVNSVPWQEYHVSRLGS